LSQDSLNPQKLNPVAIAEHVNESSCDLLKVTQGFLGFLLLPESIDKESVFINHKAADEGFKSFYIVPQLLVEFDVFVGDKNLNLLDQLHKPIPLIHVLVDDAHCSHWNIIIGLCLERVVEQELV
jgi:hypothetical protein